jgi:hypothetical protein
VLNGDIISMPDKSPKPTSSGSQFRRGRALGVPGGEGPVFGLPHARSVTGFAMIDSLEVAKKGSTFRNER